MRLRPGLGEKNGLRAGELATVTRVNSDGAASSAGDNGKAVIAMDRFEAADLAHGARAAPRARGALDKEALSLLLEAHTAACLALDSSQNMPFDLIPDENREAVLSRVIEAATTPEALQVLLQYSADRDLLDHCKALVERGADPDAASATDDRTPREIGKGSVKLRDYFKTVGLFLGRFRIVPGPPIHRSPTAVVAKADDVTTGASVAIKFFSDASQWRRETAARADNALDELYVVSSTRAEEIDPNDTTLRTLKISLKGVHLGEFIIVMPAADRNLLDIFQKERPDLDRIREMARDALQCLAHVHEKGLSHGDIKMNNVVRVDEKLRLIDLDAVAKLGGEQSFIGAKFSSAVLPPEMLYRLRDDDELRAFEDYWLEEEVGDTELWRKIAPKRDAKGDRFVVKTFRVVGDGDAPDRSRSLPYDLVPATRAVGGVGVRRAALLPARESAHRSERSRRRLRERRRDGDALRLERRDRPRQARQGGRSRRARSALASARRRPVQAPRPERRPRARVLRPRECRQAARARSEVRRAVHRHAAGAHRQIRRRGLRDGGVGYSR